MEPYKYYNPENEIFGYSPNEIIYVDAPSNCNELEPCDPNSYTNENKKACLAQEICTNQRSIENVMKPRATNGRYVDSKNIYLYQIVHMANLITGCLILALFIYRNNK